MAVARSGSAVRKRRCNSKPTRATTLPAPISATSALAEVAIDLVESLLSEHRNQRTLSLLAISTSHLGAELFPQLELPFSLADDGKRPGTRKGQTRLRADRALDAIRDRFGIESVGYASGALGRPASVPDAFRSLAEKEL